MKNVFNGSALFLNRLLCSKHFTRPGLASLMVLSFVAGGCGESQVAVFPVTGKVTFRGESPAGASVILHPDATGTSLPKDLIATGKVKADGTFAIGVYGAGDGAPNGDYVLTVVWNRVITNEGGSGAGPNVIPAQYSDPKKSPVKVKVAGGPVQVPPLVITE